MIKFIAFMDNPPPTIESGTFQEVLREWGHTWMWEGLKLSGKDGNDTGTWLSTAIRNNTLVAVTDGLYMKELYPNINSCVFIFECSAGGGRLTGAFSEQTMVACSYRGELLGLLAIHLILLSINKVNPNLLGSVHIYSDCLLGALHKVKNLPPHRIPSKCRHSDVLKNIMIHCSAIMFDRLFSHVPTRPHTSPLTRTTERTLKTYHGNLS
jgi:hypothetical protein